MSIQVSKRGHELLRDPLLNKGSAFSAEERDTFALHGLLPAEVSDLAQQARRAMAQIEEAATPLAQYAVLGALHDRNETLFYHVLMAHLEALMPVVYTPTVGAATQHFSRVYQRGRGLWITPADRGRIADVLKEAAEDRAVELIVATDNEAILGIGDQGAGGMAISVGKLALYVAGAGISPRATLPVSLDVGTNNQALLDDPMYLGLRQPRLGGDAYLALVDEFVEAVAAVFPGALVQWEDFRKDNALNLLDRYRHRLPSFNDDIQGTGAVALAGIHSAGRISGVGLAEQRVVIYGAGAAGLGIARQVHAGMLREGLSVEDARHRIAVLDSRGLVTSDREGLDAYKQELAWSPEAAQGMGTSLAEVVAAFRPTVLVGSSGDAGAFNESIVSEMCRHVERPAILPFSNPTHMAEATPEDVLRWSNGQALVATGSPFAPVEINGRTVEVGQGNNVFVFPGLGRGSLACASSEITDTMVAAAAAALAESVSEAELARGLLYPEIGRLREVSDAVASAVAEQAAADGVATRPAAYDVWEATYEVYRT